MSDLFHGARLKIQRAKRHIQELLSLLVSVQALTHTVHVETDIDTGYDSLNIELGTVPEEFMCIAGDAMHNLRTALDFVANDIEFATTGQRTRHTKFPVYDTRDELLAAVNGGFKHKAPKGVIDFIVDDVQPYKGGRGDRIWALHALDIEDKHKLLIPHLKWRWIRQIRYKDESGEVFEFPEWAATGGHTPKFPTGRRNVDVTDKGHASVSIVFAHELPLGGKHIFQTLNNLAGFVDRTILDIEGKFLADAS